VPPSNQQRRNGLIDAAIALVAEHGLHGLSHRAVDEKAEVPRGTTSNYFRSREALVTATVQRIIDLHFALMAEMRTRYAGSGESISVTEFLGDVVEQALARFPGRYRAMLELTLECARNPTLRPELDRISDEAMKLTYEAHREAHGDPSHSDVELLNAFYTGVLFTSVVMPQALGGRSPGEITREMVAKVLEPRQVTSAPTRRRRR
jgi:DNA-binding transcriptional regulator YbjK